MRKTVAKIYERIGDEKSKDIFSYKLLHSLTGDVKYMKYMVRESAVGDALAKMAEEHPAEKMVIFGAGELGEWFYDCFCEAPWFHVKCFLDSNRTGKSNRGIPIIKPDTFGEDIYTALIFVCSWKFHEEQCDLLDKMGVSHENIIDVVDIMYQVRNEKQYFDLPELTNAGTDEVFIDGGCYDGINSIQFAKWCRYGEFKKIYAFEPDKENYQRCRTVLDKFFDQEKIVLCNQGLGEHSGIKNFLNDGSGSCITENGPDMVEVTALDEIIKERVTFLKLDIEGAECKAIRGGRELICRYRPKCAVCVYHKPEDIWEIPALLLEYNPDYRLFFRHYSINSNETVLYAV